MARGELVPDNLVCDMVADRLRLPDCKRGYILDGFPRTRPRPDGSKPSSKPSSLTNRGMTTTAQL